MNNNSSTRSVTNLLSELTRGMDDLAAQLPMRSTRRAANVASATRVAGAFYGNGGGDGGGNRSEGKVPTSWTPLGVLKMDEVDQQVTFLEEIRLWADVGDKIGDILSEYDIEYVAGPDDNPIDFDTIYAESEVEAELLFFLKEVFRDYVLLGYSLIGVYVDLVKFCTGNRIWDYIERAAKGPLKSGSALPKTKRPGKHPTGRARRQFPYTIDSAAACLLPFVRLDLTGGDLEFYSDDERPKAMPTRFIPRRADLVSQEKHFRTFVLVNPNAPPRPHRFTTGIVELRSSYMNMKLESVNAARASSYLSAPIIVAEYALDPRPLEKMTDKQAAIATIHYDMTTNDPLQREVQRALAANQNLDPISAGINTSILAMDSQSAQAKASTKYLTSAMNEAKHAAASGSNVSGQEEPWSVVNLSLANVAKLQVDAYNRSKYMGNELSQVTMLLPASTQHKATHMPEIHIEMIQLNKREFEEIRGRILSILSRTPTAAPDQSKTTAAQVSSSERDLQESKFSVVHVVSNIFTRVYREAGAFLDDVRMVDAITVLRDSLSEIEATQHLRNYLIDYSKLNGLTVEDLLPLVAKMRGDETTAETKLTLNSLGVWDSVVKSYVGITRLIGVLERMIASGPNRELRIKLHLNQYGQQALLVREQTGSAFGGGGGLGGGGASSQVLPTPFSGGQH